jgi:hypothetical protein
MPNVFTLIYSGGGRRDVYENFKEGTQILKVWKPLVYAFSDLNTVAACRL